MQNWSPDGVRLERSGWRDESISQRHRMWGFNCPAVDLDFLVIEYNIGKPVGLIEYKKFDARAPILNHPTYRALGCLADNQRDEPLPFLIAHYWPEIWAFRITPVNQTAYDHFDLDEILTEHDFVARLYRMRRFVLNRELSGRLNKILPSR